MKVIVFDEQHEDDLTNAINAWIEDNTPKICDIRFSTCAFALQQEQIYCFSALILYEEE
ncbi:sporulation protein Cse60 [Massilicoli timonensis]|uniref:sporulation protein Cse60 n=1 Tax=Massilicoli timonensis TaxID=2015901 RepID=UPI0023F00EA2|nr:sporulation protein Cse60 [Massilicoli timonensis]